MKNLCLLFLSLLPVVAAADIDDHDTAKRLREAGEIVSLEKLLVDVRNRHSGRVLEVELENKRGQLVYEIEMVDDDGKVHEFFYDARNGGLLWEEDENSGVGK